jgi:hypothetical protein
MIMGLDLWFREDVARILASAQETLRASTQAISPASPETASAYQQGFMDALRVVGIAFGVASPAPPTWLGERMTLLEGGTLLEDGSRIIRRP